MANRRLFVSGTKATIRPTFDVNRAGGKAYKLTDAEALCQYAVTCTFSNVYYATADEQLDEVKRLCASVEPELVAKVAVYSRENGKMKDIPAYLLAYLASIGEIELLKKAFPRVVDNPKMMLNFVQIVRSGVTGRRSFGSAVKKLIQDWITSRRGNKLFLASIGYSAPSLADVIRMVHPLPTNDEQSALFAYLLGADIELDESTNGLVIVRKNKQGDIVQQYPYADLPPLVRDFEAFKADNEQPLPDLDYRALTNCNLTEDHWKQIALNMPWNTLRLNLNVLARNGVFEDMQIAKKVADKLANREEVKKWNAFPYQLLTTYTNVDEKVPYVVRDALQTALEYSTENVPLLGERVGIAVDVSGSMSSAVTGSRPGSHTTSVQCIEVASLIATSLTRTNPHAVVVSFGSTARIVPNFNPRDSLSTNTTKIRTECNVVGHSTNAAAAMEVFNRHGKFDFIVFVSDCQSWVDSIYSQSRGTPLMDLWAAQRRKNEHAKLAEINVQAYGDSQADSKRKEILNVGGFSDSVFTVLGEFAKRPDGVKFVDIIRQVEL